MRGHRGTLSYIFNRPFDLQTFIINLHHITDKTFKMNTEICCDNRVFNSHITLGQNAGQRQICCNTKLHLETNQRKLINIPSKYHIPFARSRIEFNNEHHKCKLAIRKFQYKTSCIYMYACNLTKVRPPSIFTIT